ncbi:MAG TPA: translational GTPase TypA [Armatimonadota bacterium]|jgi:GTP-binding protein
MSTPVLTPEIHGHTDLLPLRNIAIIAHVDHGKTTLVDEMLKQAGSFRANQHVEERMMDSNPLERERGITILAKNTSVRWGDVKINIVDTPGHADFGGEVERILRMVDSVLLLVDAADGPMPQTRFVLRKALELGLRPIVVINKIDRNGARPHQVHDEVFDLFVELNAHDEQLDFPTVFASAKFGTATYDPAVENGDLVPLFDTIIKHVAPPKVEFEGPFQMLISTLDYSPYLGQLAIGRIERGRVHLGDQVLLLPLNGVPTRAKVTRLFIFENINRIEVEEASAGEIVSLAGLESIQIGSTICDPDNPDALPGIAVDEPTVSVDFMVNTSPFAGREGKFLTSRHLRERLMRELQSNVALRVEETETADAFKVSGRGELHLTILMETMRREGYEFMVSQPKVITKTIDGVVCEPYEDLTIDVPEQYVGAVMEKLGPRRAELTDMAVNDSGQTRLRYRIPARGLFGYRTEFLTDTRGTGTLSHIFLEYAPQAGEVTRRTRGVIISMNQSSTTPYAIESIQERAVLFVGPTVEVYEGMIVGENSRENDLVVNVTRLKKLTNMRASTSDMSVSLTPPRTMSLENAIEYIQEDEYVEMTPESIRLRKKFLKAHQRKD